MCEYVPLTCVSVPLTYWTSPSMHESVPWTYADVTFTAYDLRVSPVGVAFTSAFSRSMPWRLSSMHWRM